MLGSDGDVPGVLSQPASQSVSESVTKNGSNAGEPCTTLFPSSSSSANNGAPQETTSVVRPCSRASLSNPLILRPRAGLVSSLAVGNSCLVGAGPAGLSCACGCWGGQQWSTQCV